MTHQTEKQQDDTQRGKQQQQYVIRSGKKTRQQ